MGKGGRISPATEFKPGQSGNPNGRPKKLPEIDKLLADVLGNDEENSEAKAIIKALVMKAKRGDTRAAEIILDRAYGKAKQHISLESETVKTFTVKGASGKGTVDQ